MAMITCPSCGLPNIPERRACKRCGAELRPSPAEPVIEVTPVAAQPTVVPDAVSAEQLSFQMAAQPMGVTMQQWEYRALERKRKVSDGIMNFGASDWDADIVSALNQLGAAGWELVTVTARSSSPGDAIAGTTTDELWVFKRMRPT